ncbi:MAG: hypothetical protein ABJA83_11545 [Burkholderiaceae bacterium]
MIDTHEPKNGDFIAYIEQLQRESAARLLGGGHHVITQLEKKQASTANKDGSHFFAGRKPADLRSAAQMQATLEQMAAVPSVIRLFTSAVPILLGMLLALYWLVASASIAALIMAVALVIWGVRRVQSALRQFSPREIKPAHTMVAHAFTPPPAKKL